MNKQSHWLDIIVTLLESESADLRHLAELAGGDPATFYIGADLSGVDLRGQDLRGMKFNGLESAITDTQTLLDVDADRSAHKPPLRAARASRERKPTSSELELFRDRVVRSLELSWNTELHRVATSMWINDEEDIHVVLVTSSRQLKSGSDYWYAYHRTRRDFLQKAPRGYFVLSGYDLDYVLAIPADFMEKIIDRLNKSNRNGSIYWHIKARLRGDDYRLALRGEEVSLSEFKVSL
jgi:hypothetical protein